LSASQSKRCMGHSFSSSSRIEKFDDMTSRINTSRSRHFLVTSSQVCLRSKCNFSTVLRPLTKTMALKTWRKDNITAPSALPTSNQKRLFSSEWNSYRPTEIQKLSPIDREKELFKVKRRMGAAYSKGTLDIIGNPRKVAHDLMVFKEA
jgi:hypothetical protein